MKVSSIGTWPPAILAIIRTWLQAIMPISASSVAVETVEIIDKPLSNNSGPKRKRGNGNSVAQVKRAAIKAKNRARNRSAHR